MTIKCISFFPESRTLVSSAYVIVTPWILFFFGRGSWFVCLLGSVFSHINYCRSPNAKSIFIHINTSIKTIQFSISSEFNYQKHLYFKQLSLVKVKWFQVLLCITNSSVKHQSFIYTQLNVKIDQFQWILFNINTQFTSIWLIDRTTAGATNLGQSGPGSDSTEGILPISQSSSITGASLSRS